VKHTILFVAANPADTEQLALDQECAAIEHELRIASGRDDFDLRSKWAVSIDDLMRHLNELKPTILHVSGHGTRRTAAATVEPGGPRRDLTAPGSGGIVLQDAQGSQHVSDRALAAMIASASPATRLVVLNACYSASIGEALRPKVDCVVGMDGAISDDAARSFAVAFYRALGHHCSIGNAVDQAIATLDAKEQLHAPPVCTTRNDIVADQLFLSTPDVPPQARSRRPEVQAPAPPPRPIHPHLHDLRLAYPSANKASARALYELLQPDIQVFLDERSLQPSERRGRATPAARATVILVSARSDAAWYLGDEFVTALALHRATPGAHRLIPVLLEPGLVLPYSLTHVPAIDATAAGGLAGVAAQLRSEVAAIRAQPPPAPTEPALMRSGNGRHDHFRLHDRLGQLTDPMFEQIVLDTGLERTSIAPRAAPLAGRVLDAALLAALDPTLCRRISAELDRRVPWKQR